jgi:NAD(P)-dependent dehydrogenase (short-subunit alcohol dehydrogenase family)
VTAPARTLAGRTALVTGAGGGIGRGLALALAAAGANVLIAARRAATGDQTRDGIVAEGGQALSLACDVARRDDVHAAVQAALQRYGALDVVVHNASSGQSGRAAACEQIVDAAWNEQAGIALDAAFHLAQAAFGPLRASGRGRFIVLASAQGLHGGALNPVYAALKSAQRGFVKALAREWGPHGITVNAIAPAAQTESTQAYFEAHPQLHAQLLDTIPLRRLGDVRHDIGAALVALAGDSLRDVTGQTLPVDGGAYTAL